ncbi:MAG: polysaccharide biosynthesis protein [Candidatus Woesearchaeota archaeon]|nr:polysaccharide biosynthesis protein [Candidatus Woesearchaeota archaeon]
MKNVFGNKTILVTGAVGSIGKELVRQLLRFSPRYVRLFDQDESGLFDLQHELNNPKLRFFVGNIREKDRLKVAMENVDVVFHCAALKHVMSCEYNPLEAVKTNVLGVQNIIETALECNVEKVIFTSSDKAASPDNTMGATKLLGERLFTSANFYRGAKRTIFASVRFGNVIGSNGSVIPLFKNQIKEGGPLTLTDVNMTRFIMTIDGAVRLVMKCAELAKGGEIFVLKMPSMRIKDIAEVMISELAGNRKIQIKLIGPKPGETLYEELMTDEEARQIIELEDMFVLLPKIIQKELDINFTKHYPKPKAISESLYVSNKAQLIGKEEIKVMLLKEGIL